jgi:uncharacterized protein
MVSQRLKKHANELVNLQKARPCIRKHLITKIRVFEDDHVMGIEAYGSMVFSSVKQILNDVHDTDVSVVTLLRKQRSYSLIRFVHEIV